MGKKLYFGMVGENLANRIFNDTNVDVKNYNVVLRASEVRKILLHSHGDSQKEELRGQRAITKEDLMMIPRIITNPDNIELAGYTDDNKPAISFQKTINGKTTVISYVSDKHMDLTVQTMYSGKEKSLPTTADEKSSASTPETDSGTASKLSISNDPKNVKQNSLSDKSDDIAPVGDFSTPLNELYYDIAPVKASTDTNIGNNQTVSNLETIAPPVAKNAITAPIKSIEQRIAENLKALKSELAYIIDVRSEGGNVESRIYNWGIKKDTSLDGVRDDSNNRKSYGVSLDVSNIILQETSDNVKDEAEGYSLAKLSKALCA